MVRRDSPGTDWRILPQMKIYALQKTVLSVRPNAVSFLNGLTSNTLEAPQNAFVNIHGRIVAAFEQKKLNEDEVWIALEARFVENVLEHLDRYAKLSGVVIEKLKKNVYFDLSGEALARPDDLTIPQKKGRLILTNREISANVSGEEFTLFRVKNNIPRHGVDYADDFLLNVSETDHVSFTKGCFLGQEPISKVHNRSRPTWKLVVKSEEACTPEERQKMTSKALDPQSQQTLGFVFVKNEV